MEQIIRNLTDIDVLKNIRKKDFDILLNSANVKDYPKGHPIFATDDFANIVHIIKKGRVKIFLLTKWGEEVILLILGPGDLFGFSSIYAEGKRFVSAASLEDTILWNVPSKIFENIIKKNPEFAWEIIKMIGLRLCYFRNVIEDLATKNIKGRLAKILLDLVKKSGIPQTSGILINVPLRHEDIGNMIGASRQKVTTFLNIFEKEKLIKKKRRQIVILDKEGMENLI